MNEAEALEKAERLKAENWEFMRANALPCRAENPNFKYEQWMDRPDE
jgi:hypothetical protein